MSLKNFPWIAVLFYLIVAFFVVVALTDPQSRYWLNKPISEISVAEIIIITWWTSTIASLLTRK